MVLKSIEYADDFEYDDDGCVLSEKGDNESDARETSSDRCPSDGFLSEGEIKKFEGT